MRILKLRLKNLNSIRGEVELDFTAPPLSDTGLFAIVGDTGAGKSTLLDAITLALYGRIHRSDTAQEVMSYGTAECQAELEFSVREGRYHAVWGLRRAHGRPDGNIQPTFRQLNQWDTDKQSFVEIAQKVKQTDAKVEAVTGLDFDRFCRSVLLSQGDFAAFLKAKPRDRGDLLERITGTDVYSELSKAAFERAKQEGESLKDLRRQQESLEVLTEEEEADLKSTLQEATKKAETLKPKIQALQQQISRIREWQKLEKELQAVEKELGEVEEAWKDKAPLREQLARYQKALPLQAREERITQQASQLEELAAWIESAQQRLPNDQARKKELEEKANTLANELKAFRSGLTDQYELLDQVTQLDHELERLAREISNRNQQKEEQLRSSRERTEVLQAATRRQQEKMAQLEKVSQWLQEQQRLSPLPEAWTGIELQVSEFIQSGSSLKHLQQQIKELEKEEKSLQKQLDKQAQLIEKEEVKQKDLENQLKQIRPEWVARSRTELQELRQQEFGAMEVRQEKLEKIEEWQAEYNRLLALYNQEVENLQSLRQREFDLNRQLLDQWEMMQELRQERDRREQLHQQQQAIANYAKDRAALKPGEACPLCLSTEHPFHEHPELSQPYLDTTKSDYELAKKNFDRGDREYQQLSRAFHEVGLKIEQLAGDDEKGVTGRLTELGQQIGDTERKIARLFSEVIAGKTIDPAQTGLDLQSLRRETDEQRKEWKQLLRIADQIETTGEQLNQLQREFKEVELDNLQIQRELRIRREQENKEVANRNKLEQQLQEWFRQFEIDWKKEKPEQSLEGLKKAKEVYQKHQSLQEELTITVRNLREEVNLLTEKEKESQKQAEKDERELQQLNNQLQQDRKRRKELFGEKDPKAQRIQLQARQEQLEQAARDRQKELDNHAFQLEKLQEDLTQRTQRQEELQKRQEADLKQHEGELRKAGFDDRSSLQRALEPAEKAEAWQRKIEDIRERKIRLEESQKSLQRRREELKKEPLQPEKLEILVQQHQNLEEEMQYLNREIGKLEGNLQRHQQQVKVSGELLKAIEAQRSEFRRWEELNELIGSADGTKFRVFAQGLTLQKLVALANQHLQKLNERYFIHKKEGTDLELVIRDTYQADHLRSMTTLSGGESFLVSLALALGLSDMAGRNTDIQSLFIDEGFGSLDLDSLDDALTTLENLQARGKTIGIISHVKDLKERISVQVQLVKKGSGVSSVQVTG